MERNHGPNTHSYEISIEWYFMCFLFLTCDYIVYFVIVVACCNA